MATYKFPDGMILNKDTTTLLTAADCPAGAWGAFTAEVQLAITGQYTTDKYFVGCSQVGSAQLPGVILVGAAVNTSSFAVTFYNASGADIPASTAIEFGFMTLGI